MREAVKRNRTICDQALAGVTQTALAIEWRISRERVRQILNNHRRRARLASERRRLRAGTVDAHTSIAALALTGRSLGVLGRIQVTTLGQLCRLTAETLLAQPAFGVACLRDIERSLKRYGMKLAGQ